jgi:hypothetical protein
VASKTAFRAFVLTAHWNALAAVAEDLSHASIYPQRQVSISGAPGIPLL